ncbi:hypothetical protein AVEN_81351-1 [Araneus ventricosus]|uniref:Uncharacterized protein n=1 Tax=Araneus ventricosus TaxID=182803 RepID=A0A4Y2B5T5_ARAVE|nr:hypothetical protein AVEN_81351-1 [Araneus ventricosus]
MQFSDLEFSLVTLKSRLGATRCYFGTDLVILSLGQMTRMTPEMAPSSPNFRTTSAEGQLPPTYDFRCNMLNTRRIVSGIRFRTWNSPAPKAETLPLGHHGFSDLEGGIRSPSHHITPYTLANLMNSGNHYNNKEGCNR